MLNIEQLETLRSRRPEPGHINRLSIAIELLGVTTSKAAEDMGFRQAQLSDMKRKGSPRMSTVQRITRYFGCLAEDIFPDEHVMS